MYRAIAISADFAPIEVLRSLVVCACAAVLIAAGPVAFAL